MPAKGYDASVRGTVAHKLGAWGEALTSFCLEREFPGLQFIMTGRSYVPFDLLVLDPGKTVFPRPAAISVKTTITNNSQIQLTRQDFEMAKAQAGSNGMDLYVSLVHYFLGVPGLLFGIYIARADAIGEDDFVTLHTKKGPLSVLRALPLRKKASWTFHSGDSNRKNWKKEDDGAIEGSGEEGALSPDAFPLEAGFSSPVIGAWGEYQTMMFLEWAYRQERLGVSRFDTPERDIDLFVLRPAKGTPFPGRSTISCKVVERSQFTVQVGLDQWKSMLGTASANREELWFSIIEYRYADRVMTFKDHMTRARDLDKTDFMKKNYFGKKGLYLNIASASKKASVTFGTKEIGRRVEGSGEGG